MSNLPSIPPKAANAVAKLVCSACGAPGEASCSCGVAYVPPGQHAASILADPEQAQKSDSSLEKETGISRMTFARARASTCTDVHVEKRTGRDGKIRRMPRAVVRRKSDEVQRQASINVRPEDWDRFKDQAAKEGISAAAKLGAVVSGPEIDPSTLSLSVQEKLDTAIRQAKRKLETEFEQRLQTALADALNDTVLPQYNKEINQARQIIESRKGVIPRATYRIILSCLHPDRVTDPQQKERYAKAFQAFSDIELVLCSEKEMPTSGSSIPRTYEELQKRRAEVKARRRHQSNAVQERM